MTNHTIPQSPEEQPERVREALDQVETTHEGEARDARGVGDDADDHMGAVEDETTPVTPPMDGPGHLIDGEAPEDGVDPREELHGG